MRFLCTLARRRRSTTLSSPRCVHVAPCMYACATRKKERSERTSERGGERARRRERKRAAAAADGADIAAARGRKRRSTTGRTRDNEPASRWLFASERAKRESGNAACARPYVTLAPRLCRGDLPRGLLVDSFSPSRGQPSRDRMTLWTRVAHERREKCTFFLLHCDLHFITQIVSNE